jgi:hypothetical protein
MLTFDEFFARCHGHWLIERTYHYLPSGEVERSHTEYQVAGLPDREKRRIITMALPTGTTLAEGYEADCPAFSIAFDTVSETGERRSMNLAALFILDHLVPSSQWHSPLPLPIAAAISPHDPDILTGYYLRDEGYSESGAIAGRFTYQPSRNTLEMTTVYRRSVAVDQMRLINDNTRIRTIVTYDRPTDGSAPSVINLVGSGLEQKQ